jgi:hypothetical protein
MFQAVILAALLLLLFFSRRHRLPPGPPGNVAGEFTNLTMPEVFEKWWRKYGAHHETQRCSITGPIICIQVGYSHSSSGRKLS